MRTAARTPSVPYIIYVNRFAMECSEELFCERIVEFRVLAARIDCQKQLYGSHRLTALTARIICRHIN